MNALVTTTRSTMSSWLFWGLIVGSLILFFYSWYMAFALFIIPAWSTYFALHGVLGTFGFMLWISTTAWISTFVFFAALNKA